jgi:hypothetical protein
VPEWSEVGFRVAFFFSFFGLMVSLLGFVLTLPFPSLADIPRSPTISCGIEITGSVSIVMVRGGSVGLGLDAVKLVKERLARLIPGCDKLEALNFFPPSPFGMECLVSPSPLPSLSFVRGASVFSPPFREVVSIFASGSELGEGPMKGVAGALPSATGSSPPLCVLAPRVGTRSPEWVFKSAILVPAAMSEPDAVNCLFREVLEGVGSVSIFLEGVSRAPTDAGGGDLSLGDVGHAGEF